MTLLKHLLNIKLKLGLWELCGLDTLQTSHLQRGALFCRKSSNFYVGESIITYKLHRSALCSIDVMFIKGS